VAPSVGGVPSGGSSAGGTSTGGTTSGGGAFTTGGTASGGSSGGGSGGSEPRPIVEPEPGTSLLVIDPAERRQHFQGWGTSMCWWANRVGRWTPEGVGRVADVLLDEVEGLGFNIFRYNIGGGENPSHTHMDEYKDLEGFQSSDGTFDWTLDQSQRAVLDALVARSDHLILEAFSNSPPYWMTESSCASGSSGGGNNLKADSYDDFAHYLTEVALHFRDEWGITFDTLEPLNEPNSTWWKSNGGQEGCHFSPANQEQIIQLVREQLDEKGLTETFVSAADENSIDDAITNLNGFGNGTLAAIAQINVHSYAGSKRQELRALATELGKPLWQSESGPLGISVDDDIEAALVMAERIMDDMTELGAEAWLDWQVGDVSLNWASITLNDGEEDFELRKRFYVQAAYSRFIRPGAQVLGVDAPDVLAALNLDGQSLVLVFWGGDMDRSFTLDLTQLPAVGTEAQVYRTSRTEDLEALPLLAIEGYSMVVSAPEGSLTTLVVPLP
jgi:O-glycosyl hydrolase